MCNVSTFLLTRVHTVRPPKHVSSFLEEIESSHSPNVMADKMDEEGSLRELISWDTHVLQGIQKSQSMCELTLVHATRRVAFAVKEVVKRVQIYLYPGSSQQITNMNDI